MGTDNHPVRRKPVPMPTVLKAELPTTTTEIPEPEASTRPATGLTPEDLTASVRLLATGVLFGAGAVFGVGTVVGAAATRRLRRRLGPNRR